MSDSVLDFYFASSPVTWDILMRLIAVLHIIHHLSWLVQIPGLVGEEGLQPISVILDRLKKVEKTDKSWKERLKNNPHILHIFGYTDKRLKLLCATGAFSGFLIFLSPAWFWPLMFYLLLTTVSIVHIGGPFILQTEPYFAEISFITCWFAPLIYVFNVPSFKYFYSTDIAEYGSCLGLWMVRWLIIRIMLSAGLVKWFGSHHWKDGTAMDHHYFTQPLVNPFSYYAHISPHIFHKFSVWSTFFIELVVPFLGFLPFHSVLYFVMINFIGLMFMINITGNYGYLGITTSILSLSLFYDAMLPQFLLDFHHLLIHTFPQPSQFIVYPLYNAFIGESFLFNSFLTLLKLSVIATLLLGSFIIFLLGLRCVLSCWKQNPPFKLPKFIDNLAADIQGFCIINRYGMFAAMHDYRWEIMIEGTDNFETWKRYEFKYKINDPDQRPKFIPWYYWPRLDWMIWFFPLRFKHQKEMMRVPGWFDRFLRALLENRKVVVDLLQTNPFPDHPPKAIRAVIYDYKFAGDKRNELISKVPETCKPEQLPTRNFTMLSPEYYKMKQGKWWTEIGPIAVFIGPKLAFPSS